MTKRHRAEHAGRDEERQADRSQVVDEENGRQRGAVDHRIGDEHQRGRQERHAHDVGRQDEDEHQLGDDEAEEDEAAAENRLQQRIGRQRRQCQRHSHPEIDVAEKRRARGIGLRGGKGRFGCFHFRVE